jgi:hypothetical protein
MTAAQRKRARKVANRKRAAIARRPHRDHNNERGLR